MSYPTPHINATPEDFAKTVLMPGDPLRSKFIAENFLTDAKLVNNVRGVQGYTGTYEGTPVTVMASGMGMPSIGIYSYELFNFFGVENIIRVGSTGSLKMDVKVRDIVFAMGASTNSNYGRQFELPGTFAPIADYTLLKTAIEQADVVGADYHVGNVLSSDTFYDAQEDANDYWIKMGVLCIEMETAALYMNAAKAGKRALGLFTVSDHILTHEALDAEARQTSFTQMMEIALRTAKAMEDAK
ncbi:MAG: purine-nucleoside phosphorylase [Lachnospiraceae bacterium]|nr:purine-nucleoside phosphorylase [Lachnospiraceae bacterium]MBP3295177.1 purine-nucleoside phosphorylase [Lachnospiraceae bacterium]